MTGKVVIVQLQPDHAVSMVDRGMKASIGLDVLKRSRGGKHVCGDDPGKKTADRSLTMKLAACRFGMSELCDRIVGWSVIEKVRPKRAL